MSTVTACDAASEAWLRVMQGFDAALEVEGLPADQRGRLLQCRRLAALKARHPFLSIATDRGE